jgi:hypothetical protein
MAHLNETTSHPDSLVQSVVINALQKCSSFTEAVRSGYAEVEHIDDWVDFWHLPGSPAGRKSLREFLGMSTDEYTMWMKDGAILAQIISK